MFKFFVAFLQDHRHHIHRTLKLHPARFLEGIVRNAFESHALVFLCVLRQQEQEVEHESQTCLGVKIISFLSFKKGNFEKNLVYICMCVYIWGGRGT